MKLSYLLEGFWAYAGSLYGPNTWGPKKKPAKLTPFVHDNERSKWAKRTRKKKPVSGP